jgi:hypothetical protein
MPQALTLDDMSPRLRKVVGRESPRVTSTEEPDGGNLLVRIWRGAGVGNLPAYSTTAFSTDCVRPPPATLLPPCPLLPAPGVGPHAPRQRLASAGCRRQAAGSHRSARTGRVARDGQPARLELLGGRLLAFCSRFFESGHDTHVCTLPHGSVAPAA